MATVFSTDVAMPGDFQETEEYVVEKARAITEAGPDGPAGDPREEWECRYCPYSRALSLSRRAERQRRVHASGAGAPSSDI